MVSNTQFPFIMLIVQFAVCVILQVLGEIMLVKHYNLTATEFEISREKTKYINLSDCITWKIVIITFILLMVKNAQYNN